MTSKTYSVILVLTLISIACAKPNTPNTGNTTDAVTEKNSETTIAPPDQTTIAPDTATTIAPETTTTVAPNTTTTPAPDTTTTVAPAPQSKSDSDSKETPSAIANTDKNDCVLIKLDLKIDAEIHKIDTADGTKVQSCDDKSATIRWGKELKSKISFKFIADSDNQTYMLSDSSLTIDVTDIKSGAQKPKTFDYKLSNQIKVPKGNSYECSDISDALTTGFKEGTSTDIIISNVRFQAFRKRTTATFDSPKACSPIVAPKNGLSTGAIIALCVLFAVIVLIVGIVVWRKRNNLSPFGTCARTE